MGVIGYSLFQFSHLDVSQIFIHPKPISLNAQVPYRCLYIKIPRSNNTNTEIFQVRGTLQVLQMIKKYGLNAAMGINNVGNAFTPQGSCDPLSLASLGVGIYQAGTKADAELLLQCVTNRAKLAIGMNLSVSYDVELDVGDPADFVIFGDNSTTSGTRSFRSRKTVQELIYDPPASGRTTTFNGRIVSQ